MIYNTRLEYNFNGLISGALLLDHCFISSIFKDHLGIDTF